MYYTIIIMVVILIIIIVIFVIMIVIIRTPPPKKKKKYWQLLRPLYCLHQLPTSEVLPHLALTFPPDLHPTGRKSSQRVSLSSIAPFRGQFRSSAC